VSTHERQAQADRIGRQFIEAFNRRDADGLVALSHPEIVFRPTMLVGSRRVYRGHAGLRSRVAKLITADTMHQVRVCETRSLGHQRFVVHSEVLLDGEAITPSAMVAELLGDRIVDVHAYLSDEALLTELDLLR
jgi:hypothetical protein